MHSLSLFAIAAAINGLTSAAPHPRNLHYHLHGRPLTLPPVGARSIYDGKCGPGDMCGPGYCCSQYGYCGTTPDYCGNGCQPQFGTCSSNDTAQVPPSPAPAADTSAPPSPAKAASSEASGDDTPSQIVQSQTFVTHALASPTAGGYQKPTSAPQPVPAAQPAPAPQPAVAPSPQPQNAAPTSGSPVPSPASGSGSSSGGSSIVDSAYKMFTGDGAANVGWPTQNSWTDFDSLWNANLPIMKVACAQFSQADNSDQENSDIKSAIEEASAASGVDKRFILAIMMQESKGCVRVWGTANGVANPGLMQSYKGKGTCYPGVNPCPSSEIKQMIFDGAVAHDGSDGVTLQELLAKVGGSDADSYYKVARLYNSGPNSMPADGDLGAPGATRCYCSDIANRLMGWTDKASQCTLH